MKKQLAMILIVLLIGLSVMPAGMAWAENTDSATQTEQATDPENTTGASSTQSGNGESAASAQNARDKNIFNTGTDPLWSFVEIKVPEQALVGQEFDVEITVKIWGRALACFPNSALPRKVTKRR